MDGKRRRTVSQALPFTPAQESLLDALGDPTRRRIVAILNGGPLPVGRIAENLPVSRPAVSQHLRVLKDAGLVVDHAQANRRLYAIDPAGLAALRAFLDSFWEDALQRFTRFAEEKPASRRRASSRNRSSSSLSA